MDNMVEVSSIQPIIEALPYCIYVVDKKGNLTNTNKNGLNILNRFPESVQNKHIMDIFNFYKLNIQNNEGIYKYEDILDKVLKDGLEIKNITLNYNRYVEKQRCLSLNCSPIYIEGEISGAIISLADITDEHFKNLKIKEEREQFISLSTELKTKCDIIEILRDREKDHLRHLKDVINNISEGLVVLDSNGKFSFCNKYVYSIIEVSLGGILDYSNITKKYNIEYIDGENNVIYYMYNSYFKDISDIKSVVIKLTEKETGRIKYIEFNSSPIVNTERKLMYTIITLKDVTEIKEHEIYAEEQANFIKDVVNTMDIPIAVLDYPSLNTRLGNKKFELLINLLLSPEQKIEVINKSLIDLFKENEDNTLPEIIDFCGHIGKEYTYSPFHIKDCNGNDRFYKIKFKPYKDRTGVINRIHTHASDITEEINHNLELEKITQLKDEFFTIISHELRTPLTIIYSSLQLAYDVYSKEITPNLDKTLSRINQNCSRLLKLINNILDISKAEAGFLNVNTVNFDIVNVTEFIVTSVNSYATSKNIDLIFDTNEEEAEVSLDKDKYEKVILNLLSNAIKFTPGGKKIFVNLNINKEKIELKVKDQGIGIPEDKVHSIFDRFAQVNSSLSRRAEGTGLGLSLVKKLVELMGGTINVMSKVDEGSEFIIIFENRYIKKTEIISYNMVSQNMNDKINIEFSDIG